VRVVFLARLVTSAIGVGRSRCTTSVAPSGDQPTRAVPSRERCTLNVAGFARLYSVTQSRGSGLASQSGVAGAWAGGGGGVSACGGGAAGDDGVVAGGVVCATAVPIDASIARTKRPLHSNERPRQDLLTVIWIPFRSRALPSGSLFV
jgi:hypothetical protein